MKHITFNEHGFAIVYALVILLLVTVAGTALLFLTRKDSGNAADYSKIRTESQAAIAALKACEGQFLNTPVEALAILTQFKTNSSAKWMLGTAANATSEQKIALTDKPNTPRYSARIVKYDENKAMVVLEGTGYLPNNGGKKKALATYQLSGIGLSNRPIGTDWGLFLGGPIQNWNSTTTIKGNTYLSMSGTDDQHLNGSAVLTFEGNLKTGTNTSTLEIGCDFYVKGKGFFRCKLKPNNSSKTFKITKEAGFTGGFASDWLNVGSMVIKCDHHAYFTAASNFGFAGCIDGNNGATPARKVYYNKKTASSGVDANRFIEFDGGHEQITTSTDAYVGQQLGLDGTTDATYTANMPANDAAWGSNVVKYVSGDITADMVNTWWGEQSLYQGQWLVLKLSGKVTGKGGTFTKKAIWIVDNQSICGTWFNSSPESNTFIYVTGTTGKLDPLYLAGGSVFRGFVYSNSTIDMQIFQMGSSGSSPLVTVYGAIHLKEKKFNINSGGPFEIDFAGSLGQSALQEIANTGLLLAPGQTTLTARVPVLVDTKIRPTQLNLQM